MTFDSNHDPEEAQNAALAASAAPRSPEDDLRSRSVIVIAKFTEGGWITASASPLAALVRFAV